MSLPLPIAHNVALTDKNTFGVEAACASYLQVTDAAMLARVREDKKLSSMRRLVLGGGSNLVLTGDFDGLVLHMANTGIDVVAQTDSATIVRAAAGENWHRFVLRTIEQGLGGLENLSLIPGSVGAAPIQNIGAYGVEVRELITEVRIFDFTTGEIRSLDNADCRFAYRDSAFKHELAERAVVLDVSFALPREWKANTRYADVAHELEARRLAGLLAHDDAALTPREISDAVIAVRSRKLPDPAVIGNAGSFFKNPLVPAAQRDEVLAAHPQLVSYAQPDGSFKLAAGWLIDQCGWKGKSLGPAGVYEKQALVLVNRGGARGADVVALARAIQADVLQKFAVQLEPEPVFV